MEEIKELRAWDFPDRHRASDGYNFEAEPDLSLQNFLLLIEKINELIDRANALSNEK